MEKYSWSFNKDAEIYHNSGNTIEECLAAARETEQSEKDKHICIYIGENMPFIPTVDADDVLEKITEEAHDFSEYAEDWYPQSAEQKALDELSAQLTPIVQEWLKEHGYEPAFWQVQDIKRYFLWEEQSND